VAELLKHARPDLLVGVPTLHDALLKDPSLANSDLSCLRACFSGADTLPRPVKERFEALVAAHVGTALPGLSSGGRAQGRQLARACSGAVFRSCGGTGRGWLQGC
jgi:acyl-CoA synthetase (AMP-forming)/AMP-acid ligase II